MGVKFKFIIMRTLEEQINYLECRIQKMIITLGILEIKPVMFFDETFIKGQRNDILELSEILDSLYILLERDQICDNCVNNYFDNQN